MKKSIALFVFVLSAFYFLTLFSGCATTPPPNPPPAVTPPPPPPAPNEEQAVLPEKPDMSPPEISIELIPQPYCPITPDGEEQYLTINVDVKSASPIYLWHVELREAESDELFLTMDYEGDLPETLFWDGRNYKGELVESATLYNYTVTAYNIYHNSLVDREGYIIPEDKIGEEDKIDEIEGQLVNGSTTYKGTLAIDLIVKKEGKGLLRIIVPSIIFAPDNGELVRGLDSATSEKNDRILRRIAEVLNYFETYKIRVEGHANPTYPPNSRLRASEETGTRTILGLRPLSEQRAKAVVNYLVDLGIDRERLSAVGMGGTNVRAQFTDRSNWWKNRRVEFVLEKPESDED
jgi:flagellar motor protein MotB